MNETDVIDNFTDCQDFAFFDRRDLAFNYFLDERILDERLEKINKPSNGSKIVYFFYGKPVHYGILWCDKILSKLGTNGKISRHNLDDLNYKYNLIKFYKGTLCDLSDINEREFV